MTMQTVAPVSSKVLTVKPNDKLLIVVNAKDPIVADMFNLPYMSRYVGQSSTRYTQNQGALAYTVNAAGDIDFPFLGEIHVAGMSRPEVAGLIKGMLIAGDYIKDPSVTVEIQNA
ncbi:MAG: polysaccharide export protein, partial [Muribaculaceae bacterium]|nr:polysaccharide export protein [Muribaculaceae bacterium]